jgi:hypothetical protein
MAKVAVAGTTVKVNVAPEFSATDKSSGAVIATVGVCPKERATKLTINKILAKMYRRNNVLLLFSSVTILNSL